MRRSALVAAALAVTASLAACSTRQPDSTLPTERGGTLHVLLDSRVGAWDPQRIGTREESAFAVRTFLRTLTSQAPAGVGFLPGLVGDLSTTTGVVQDGGRSWIFSLVSDAPWQDGRFVTCADVKYGVSRSFAADRVTGGSQYAVDLLDIPSTTDAQGRTVSAYQGPWSGVGQDLYDRAVTCDGQDITFHLKKPRFDFDEIVSLPAFAPVRQDQDTDRTNRDPYSVFASGPYMLEGVWKPGEGGRFVRNRKWIARDDPVRNAWPDVIEVEEGLPATTVAQRLLDSRGDDATALTFSDAPPALDAQLRSPDVAGRVSRPDSGTVDALLPTVTGSALADPTVRRAFGLATARQAYADAEGSPMTPTTSVLAQGIPGRPTAPPEGLPTAGDPAAARALLASTGATLPVAVRVGYTPSEATSRALTALLGPWAQGGFAVTLVPQTDGVTAPVDARLTEVAADFPAGSAVLPALAARVGDPALTAAADAAAALPDRGDRAAAWGALDGRLVAAGDVVPLAEQQRVLLRGAGVQAYQDSLLLGGYPDLAGVTVQHEAD